MPVMVYSDRRGTAGQWEHSIQKPWPIRGQGILSSSVREPKVVTVPLFHHRRTPLSRGFENISKLSIYITDQILVKRGYEYHVMRLELSTWEHPQVVACNFAISISGPHHCRCWGSDWGGGITGVVPEGAGWLPRGQDQRHVLQLERRPGLLCPHTQIQASPHWLPKPWHQGLERVMESSIYLKYQRLK